MKTVDREMNAHSRKTPKNDCYNELRIKRSSHNCIMDWHCSECTLINPAELNICSVCEQGYRLFSVDRSQDDSASSSDEDQTSEQENLLGKTIK